MSIDMSKFQFNEKQLEYMHAHQRLVAAHGAMKQIQKELVTANGRMMSARNAMTCKELELIHEYIVQMIADQQKERARK